MPLPSLFSAQSSSSINFSSGFGATSGGTFLLESVNILLLHQYCKLIAKGAESNIYLSSFFSRKTISKIRFPKSYRHQALDAQIRKQRTIHESKMISLARYVGIRTPFVFMVDPVRAEIVMEYIKGLNTRDKIDKQICLKIGEYTSVLHKNDIIHGDLTPSNFLLGDALVLLDFGLSYRSNRIEDKAVDIRLLDEIFKSLYPSNFKSFYESFLEGYRTWIDSEEVNRILKNLKQIDSRRRYA
jgi:TP53 regulating kinase and related kinases